jgi:hypothetical protein
MDTLKFLSCSNQLKTNGCNNLLLDSLAQQFSMCHDHQSFKFVESEIVVPALKNTDVSCDDRVIWTTQGKSYPEWICSLVSFLLSKYFRSDELGSSEHKLIDKSVSVKCRCSFLYALRYIAAIDFKLAETSFSWVLNELLTSSNDTKRNITNILASEILVPENCMPRSVQLLCDSLIFLQRLYCTQVSVKPSILKRSRSVASAPSTTCVNVWAQYYF